MVSVQMRERSHFNGWSRLHWQSSTCLELYGPVNTKLSSLIIWWIPPRNFRRVSELTGDKIDFHQVDLLDYFCTINVMKQYRSLWNLRNLNICCNPLCRSQSCRRIMVGLPLLPQQHHWHSIYFGPCKNGKHFKNNSSSSATVYGDTHWNSDTGNLFLGSGFPYAWLKPTLNKSFKMSSSTKSRPYAISNLRYFNPVELMLLVK